MYVKSMKLNRISKEHLHSMCVFVNTYRYMFDWVKDFLVPYLALHGVSLAMREGTSMLFPSESAIIIKKNWWTDV